MRNVLTEKESKNYLLYLYDYVNHLTGTDSEVSQKVRDIIYGKDIFFDTVLVQIIRTTGAMKPLDWLRENNINLILEE